MKKAFAAVCLMPLVAACAPPPPANPAEQAARAGAAYEYAARNCGGMPGGFKDVVAMRDQSVARYALARELGASEEVIAAQKQIVANTVSGAVVLIGQVEACRALISEAAWNAT